ncbi:MAG: SpoIIIAC/SpoIIIAD family protein [Candidatus Borkfalkiaceae bacterium]|nr:SpoIIIAC/SpoIIIAD family protein [Christensenellaceae bacterium]
MELIKIAAVGVVCSLVVVYLKNSDSQLAGLATVASGVLLLILTVGYAADFLSLLTSLGDYAQTGGQVVKIVIKILGISYLVEFTADVIDDMGLKSVSDKVVLAGKILIITAAFPVIENLIKIVINLL